MLRFRESFRGYNRDDVNAYIEQINLHFSKKEADLRAIIADLENKVNQNSNINNNAEIESLKKQISELNNANSTLESELAKAKASVESEAEQKSKLYDSMSSQVGSIIIQANSNAEKIVAEAKIEAENIKMNASLRAKEITDEALKKKEETIRYIEEALNAASVECISEYSEIISETNSKLISISDNAKAKAEKMLLNLENKASLIKGE